MSDQSPTPFVNRASGAAVAFTVIIVFLVVITLAARFAVPTPAVDADRAAARYKALADMHATEDAAIDTAAVIDQDRQTVRLPIDLAMEITAREWQQNPEKARADLIARGQKATAALPKTAPKPSAFE